MGQGRNVIDELMTDHREVEEMFARFQAMTAGGQQLRDMVDEVTIEGVTRVMPIPARRGLHWSSTKRWQCRPRLSARAPITG